MIVYDYSTGLFTTVTIPTITPGQIVGTATNDNAAAGNVGEYVESVFSAVNATTSTNWGDATSISLTAGDWDVDLNILLSWIAGVITQNDFGVSKTSGNSTTGLVIGSNYFNYVANATSATNANGNVTRWRVSLSATTTIYAKHRYIYNSTAPQSYGRLSARRVR